MSERTRPPTDERGNQAPVEQQLRGRLADALAVDQIAQRRHKAARNLTPAVPIAAKANSAKPVVRDGPRPFLLRATRARTYIVEPAMVWDADQRGPASYACRLGLPTPCTYLPSVARLAQWVHVDADRSRWAQL